MFMRQTQLLQILSELNCAQMTLALARLVKSKVPELNSDDLLPYLLIEGVGCGYCIPIHLAFCRVRLKWSAALSCFVGRRRR